MNSNHSSPILYTKMMLSLCPTAILEESGEKAIPRTVYDFLPNYSGRWWWGRGR